MKETILAVLAMFILLVATSDKAAAAPTCSASACTDTGAGQWQGQGMTNSVDNSNNAVASPTAVVSSTTQLFGGNNMNMALGDVSCPVAQLVGLGSVGQTDSRPGDYTSTNQQVGVGVMVPLGTGDCNKAAAAKLYAYEKFNQEGDWRSCMAVRNDGMEAMAWDDDVVRQFPWLGKCRAIFDRINRFPEQFRQAAPAASEVALLRAKIANLEAVQSGIIKK